MKLNTAAGSTLAICAAPPATQDAAGYAALTFVKVGAVEKIGSIGPTFAKVEFQPLDGTKIKLKGSVDNGSLQPSIGVDDSDAGQTLLRTAAYDKLNTPYTFCVTYQSGAKRYFVGLVFGWPENTDGADSVFTVAPTIEINTDIVRVAAA